MYHEEKMDARRGLCPGAGADGLCRCPQGDDPGSRGDDPGSHGDDCTGGAFALRTPSVWNVIIETASLSDKFLEKHADLIDLVSYIEGIYIIDNENSQLIPIDTKPDPNDQAKSSARRIKAFYDVISQLSSEEYYTLRSIVGSYDDEASKMSYQIPACNCPECATEIPANTDMSPDNMLFTRHQLAAIGSM